MECQPGAGIGTLRGLDPALTVSGGVAPGGGAAKLLVDGVSKCYGPVVALEPVDLDVRHGELLTLLGPSGSGKTTLLQLICGLVEASEGRVVIDGRDQSSTPVHQRDIGLVFQHYALFPHLTVAENIAFPLKMRGRPGAEIAKRVAAALEMVHLGHLSARFPRELSGGQQQRVALARALAPKPPLILLDEPFSGLDARLRDQVRDRTLHLLKQSGQTTLMVTHDAEEAMFMADRIAVMRSGRNIQTDRPDKLYYQPANAFVTEFFSDVNR